MIRRIDRPSFLAGLLTVVLAIALMAQVNVPTFPISIAHGGTNGTTATAGFDNLSPLTTRGDLIYRNASNNVRLAAGTSGRYLQTLGSGADPAWASVPAFTGQLAQGGGAGLSPLDSTTYYYGTLFGVNPATGDDTPGFYIAKACTLVAVYGRFTVAGTLGSSENNTLTLRKNGTTDILTVTSTLQLTAAANEYSSTGNAVALSAGDRVYMKWVTPAWVTNPTAVFMNATLYFEVP